MFSASGDPWRQWSVIPPESSAGYSCFPWIQKTSASQARLRHTSSWRKQPQLSATSLTPRSHPPDSATAYSNHPVGIENSTGLRLFWKRLGVKFCMPKPQPPKAVETEALWAQTVWCYQATDCAFICKVCYALPLAAQIISSWRGGREMWQRDALQRVAF